MIRHLSPVRSNENNTGMAERLPCRPTALSYRHDPDMMRAGCRFPAGSFDGRVMGGKSARSNVPDEGWQYVP
jgi:hypothetical protein